MVNPGNTREEQAYWLREYENARANHKSPEDANALATQSLEIKRKLLRAEAASEGTKEGHWVTIDEQAVLVGGPGEGSGGAASSPGYRKIGEVRSVALGGQLQSVYRGKQVPPEMYKPGGIAILLVTDKDTITALNPDEGVAHADIAMLAGLSTTEFDSAARLWWQDDMLWAARFALGIGFKPSNEAAFSQISQVAARLIHASVPEATLLRYGIGNLWENKVLILSLIQWSEGRKELKEKAHWVTIDDDQHVLIGGPGEGTGATPRQVGLIHGKRIWKGETVPQSIRESPRAMLMIVDDDIYSTLTPNVFHGEIAYAVGIRPEKFDRSIRITQKDGELSTAFFQLGLPDPGGRTDYQSDEVYAQLAVMARKLIQAGYSEDTQVNYFNKRYALGLLAGSRKELQGAKAQPSAKPKKPSPQAVAIAKAAKKKKVTPEIVQADLIDPWLQSVFGTPASQRLQKIAARTFGYRDPAGTEEMDINWQLLYPMGELYNITQNALEKLGYQREQTIEVYHPYIPKDATPKGWKKGQEVRIKLLPLSSWTTSIQEAAKFASYLASSGTPAMVLKTFVPVGSVISTPETGIGVPGTHEVVLGGGEYEAIVELKL